MKGGVDGRVLWLKDGLLSRWMDEIYIYIYGEVEEVG